MLTHENYFDTLTALKSTTAEWRSVLAGFLVLRLVDAWLDNDASLIARDLPGIQAVREALSNLRERDPVFPVLCELTEIVTQMEQSMVSSVAPSMLHYGKVLAFNGHWRLALDVFASLLSHAEAVQNHHVAVRAAERLGVVLRRLGQFDASDQAYALVTQRAMRINQSAVYFYACGGIAENLAQRGRLVEAKKVLVRAINEASAYPLENAEACLLHERVILAGTSGDYRTGILLGWQALPRMTNSVQRHGLLSTIGAAYVGNGNHVLARDLFSYLLPIVQQENVRQEILINLLEIAAKEADKASFERHRTELDGILQLPELQAHYHLYMAKGKYNFGDISAARESWRSAFDIAVTHGLIQTCTVIRTEAATFGVYLPEVSPL